MVISLPKGSQNQQQQQKPKSTSAPTHHSTPLTSGITQFWIEIIFIHDKSLKIHKVLDISFTVRLGM